MLLIISTRENIRLIARSSFQQCGMCDQQRLRSACAYAQSDQSLCLSLEYSTSVRLLTEHHLEFLSLKGGCTGSSESTLVKKSHCWKSHVMTQLCGICSYLIFFYLKLEARDKMMKRCLVVTRCLPHPVTPITLARSNIATKPSVLAFTSQQNPVQSGIITTSLILLDLGGKKQETRFL